ncbi:MAG: BamA/TamA family outer membrane protein [Bdellovibrionales bacterium]|nr:BamA/TamA family outer membrane protein [Bdellovibrionales bacterium]
MTGAWIKAFLIANSVLAANPPEIDRIEIIGVTLLKQSEIESVMEVNVGDRLERSKVVRTAESLIGLYRAQGYDDVQVKGELGTDKVAGSRRSETVLRFVIREGLPTKVEQIRFSQMGSRSEANWKGMESQILEKLPLHQGSVLEQEKLNAAKRVIQEVLVSDEYVGAKVDDVRLEPSPKGTADGAKWVNLEFVVDSGDRATFGFRGNEFFDRGALLDFIADQRTIGFSKDYVGSIQKRIREEYHAQGFPSVEIVSYVLERPAKKERHITFEIREGPRVKLEALIFDGQSVFTQEVLEAGFMSRASKLVRKGIYVEKDIQAASDSLIESLKSQGYLSARLVGINRNYQDQGREARVVIYLYEGVQTLIDQIQIQGNKSLTTPEASKEIGIEIGKPLNPFTLSEGIESLKRLYGNRGMLNMRIKNEESGEIVLYSRDERRATIQLDIEEGPAFRVRKIEVLGLENTRAEVVTRELLLKEGDLVALGALSESELRLRKLGIFSEASIRITEPNNAADAADKRDIRIQIQEGSPGFMAGGAGYRQDLGTRGFGQVGYTNIMGKNHEISLGVNTNYRRWGGIFCEDSRANCFPEFQLQLNYVWPWFLGDKSTYRPRIGFERTRFKIFDSYSFTIANVWERRLFTKPNIIATFAHNLELVKFSNAQNAVDNQSLTIGAIIPSVRLDLRDNPLAPTRGIFAFSSIEIADPWLGSQAAPVPVSYYRFQFRLDGHVPVSRETQWFLSFRTGYARNNTLAPPGTPDDEALRYAIPLSKQFTLGGVTSLRGFQEQEWNMQSFAIRGSIGYMNIRTQLDLPFAGAMRFGPFIDAGNLFRDRYVIGNFRYGGGFGFHYQSPVGPVNFDLGWKLDRQPGEQPFVFYFSVGIL